MNSSGGIRRLARFYVGAVLLAGGALAGLTWYAVASADSLSRDREDEQRFAQLTYEVTSKVEQVHTMLRGVQGLFMASDSITRTDFHQYARAMHVGEGAEVLALQFARWVPQPQRADFEAGVRADASLQPGGYPDFRIVPPGERPFYVATEYNEPMHGNEAAFGFDTASGPVRAAVLQASRDSGEITASAPFTLVQTGKTGVVIRAPIYRRNAPLADVEDRRREYRGQVSVVFVADRLLGRALGHHLLPETEISLADAGAVRGPAPGASGLLPLGRYGSLPGPSAWRQERMLAQVIAVHGRFWSLEMRSRPVTPLLHGKALTAGTLVLTLTLLVAGLLRRAIGQRDQAQARASAVLSATLTGIIAIDMAGLIRSANPAACSLFGHPEGELIGRPFAMLVPELAHDGMPRVGTVRNVVGATRDGQPLELAMSLGEVTGGRSPQFLASFHDISIEKRIQEQQRTFARELEATVESRTADLTRVNQELEAFAYSVAHDLRAPVRHVHGFARVLELRHRAGMDDKARDYLARIVAAAHGMGRLIDDLLAFSQLSHHELAVGPVDLGEGLRSCIDALGPELEGRAVQWRIGPLPVVRGDAALLALVMSNLVGNAVKYSARSTPAVIEVFSEDAGPDEDCIAVRDNGVGLDMQYAHRLFKVFSRLHHQDEFEGTGVGLANVRRIVERHGGKVWVESQPGAGACFRFTLPRRTGTV